MHHLPSMMAEAVVERLRSLPSRGSGGGGFVSTEDAQEVRKEVDCVTGVSCT